MKYLRQTSETDLDKAFFPQPLHRIGTFEVKRDAPEGQHFFS
jgi:hypothetical protein